MQSPPAVLGLVCILSFLKACNTPFVPKQRGYYKIDLPAKSYQVFDGFRVTVKLIIFNIELWDVEGIVALKERFFLSPIQSNASLLLGNTYEGNKQQ